MSSEHSSGQRTPPLKRAKSYCEASPLSTQCVLARYKHQVGGHNVMFKCAGKIYKPVRDLSEQDFYEQIFSRVPKLGDHIPKYFGATSDFVFEDSQTLGATEDKAPSAFLALEDITQGMKLPCVLDLKLGRRVSPETQPMSKQNSKLKKCLSSTSDALGFRVSGMQVWNHEKQSFFHWDKAQGMSLTCETVLQTFPLFLNNGLGIRVDLLPRFLSQLNALTVVLLEQTEYRFFGSSLIFCYDAADPNTRVELRMVDFAHVRPFSPANMDTVPDPGCLHGLASIASMLSALASGGTTSLDLRTSCAADLLFASIDSTTNTTTTASSTTTTTASTTTAVVASSHELTLRSARELAFNNDDTSSSGGDHQALFSYEGSPAGDAVAAHVGTAPRSPRSLSLGSEGECLEQLGLDVLSPSSPESLARDDEEGEQSSLCSVSDSEGALALP